MGSGTVTLPVVPIWIGTQDNSFVDLLEASREHSANTPPSALLGEHVGTPEIDQGEVLSSGAVRS
ncbi:hypothetical protein D3C72_2164810 [compost metagenome]